MEPLVADCQPLPEPLERRGGHLRRRRGQEAVQVLHQPHAAGRRQRVPRLVSGPTGLDHEKQLIEFHQLGKISHVFRSGPAGFDP